MSSEAQLEPGSPAPARQTPAEGTPLPVAEHGRRWLQRHSLGIYAGLLMVILLAAILSPRVVVIVPAGHAGVMWRPFSGGVPAAPAPPDPACTRLPGGHGAPKYRPAGVLVESTPEPAAQQARSVFGEACTNQARGEKVRQGRGRGEVLC